MDKDLSERKKILIGKHVKHCPRCRAFRDNILLLEEEAKNIEIAEVSQIYQQQFASRLKSKIMSLEDKEKKEALSFFKQKWVLASSAFIMVAILGAVILLFLARHEQEVEFFAFSFSDAIEEVYWEIGDDIELERAFNSQILTSINDLLSPSAWTEIQRVEDDLFLWDDLTDEELQFLESEIKKETKL